MNKDVRNQLIEKLESYASQIFFYCIKRCNNRMDAEDLSQSILLECVNQINKGTIINNMDYYIWGVCRNMYNQYLRGVIRERENVELKDEIKCKDKKISILELEIQNEKVKKMNSAIKLLSKDYLEILYAYYIEDKTLKYIADELNLPLGTITWKLSEIRKKLKEYLKMEKLNGKRAYVPKEFQVSMMCTKEGKYNPCLEVASMIHKNLLYHSFNNPCTIEDYSLELGIARPYVEEIVSRLTDVTLLKKEGNKYITNFAFIDKAVLNKILDTKAKYSNIIYKQLKKFVLENIDIYKSYMKLSNIENDKLMWTLLLYIMFFLECKYFHQYEHTLRPGNGKWDFVMVEGDDIDRISVHGFGEILYYGYVFSSSMNKDVIYSNKALDGSENFGVIYNFLKEINDNGYIDDNNKFAEKYAKELKKELLVNVVNNKIEFNIPIIMESDLFKIHEIISSDKYNEIHQSYKQMGEEIRNILDENLPPYLKNQLDYLVSSFAIVKGDVIDKFSENGLLCNINENDYITYNGLIILKK